MSKHFVKYILFFAFIPASVFSQPKSFSSLSKYEKCWAFVHPFASLKIKKHQQEMYLVYEEVKNKKVLDEFSNGGNLDAFRHVFAMAYFSKYVKAKKLRKLGVAHEKGNYLQYKKGLKEEGEIPDSVSSVMDLKNNELGFLIGKDFKKLPLDQLKLKVVEAIHEGKAFIIKRNKEGFYLDCTGNVIPEEKIKGTWNNSKCLVGSGS